MLASIPVPSFNPSALRAIVAEKWGLRGGLRALQAASGVRADRLSIIASGRFHPGAPTLRRILVAFSPEEQRRICPELAPEGDEG